jgi:hypothetical protein
MKQFETRPYTIMYVDAQGNPIKGFYDDEEGARHIEDFVAGSDAHPDPQDEIDLEADVDQE